MPTNKLELDTERGGIEIREDELPKITDGGVDRVRNIARNPAPLFCRGGGLMQSINPADLVRSYAAPRLDGQWKVRLFR